MDEIIKRRKSYFKYLAKKEFEEDVSFILKNSKKELNFLSNKKVFFQGGGGFLGFFFIW